MTETSKTFDPDATSIVTLDSADTFTMHPNLTTLCFDRIVHLNINQNVIKLQGIICNFVKLPRSLREAHIQGNFDFSGCVDLVDLFCEDSLVVDVRNVKMLESCFIIRCKKLIHNENIRSLFIRKLDNFTSMKNLKKLGIAQCENFNIKKLDLVELETDVIFNFPPVEKLKLTAPLKFTGFVVPDDLLELIISCDYLIANKRCLLRKLSGDVKFLPASLPNLTTLELLNVRNVKCYMPKLTRIGSLCEVKRIFPTRVVVDYPINYKRSKNTRFRSSDEAYQGLKYMKDQSYCKYKRYTYNKFLFQIDSNYFI
jgi:hypothetical protein